MIRKHDMDVSTHESIRLLAVSEEWRLTWAANKDIKLPYWDAHALPIQRYYNVNCCLRAPTRPRCTYFSTLRICRPTVDSTAGGNSSRPSRLALAAHDIRATDAPVGGEVAAGDESAG